ncbi:hypothetical protein ACJX0J_021386, partial [Zea mays]
IYLNTSHMPFKFFAFHLALQLVHFLYHHCVTAEIPKVFEDKCFHKPITTRISIYAKLTKKLVQILGTESKLVHIVINNELEDTDYYNPC